MIGDIKDNTINIISNEYSIDEVKKYMNEYNQDIYPCIVHIYIYIYIYIRRLRYIWIDSRWKRAICSQ